MNNSEFPILITIKNKRLDIEETLNQLSHFINNDSVEFLICDDGASDCTSDFIESNYKMIQLNKTQVKGFVGWGRI